MEKPDLPREVLDFVADKIDTVPQLEALLLLWENPTRGWACEELAARLYVGRDACATLLEALRRRELVEVAEGETPLRYRYRGAWDERGVVMQQVASAYRTQLVTIATLIHTKAPSSLREFARAFDLKGGR
jgi:hypothetical protein